MVQTAWMDWRDDRKSIPYLYYMDSDGVYRIKPDGQWEKISVEISEDDKGITWDFGYRWTTA